MKQLLSGNLSWKAVITIAAFLVPVVSAGAAPPTYSLIPLGLVSTPQICGNGIGTPAGVSINAAGDVTGFYCLQNGTPQGEVRGYLWAQQGGVVDLGLPAGVTDPTTLVVPSSINAHRQITGTVANSSLHDAAFVWDRGSFTLIAPNAEGDGINDPGQVSGTLVFPAEHVFLYSHGKVMDLGVGVAGATDSQGGVINNSGHIAAEADTVHTDGTVSDVLILWTGAGWRNLGDPPTGDTPGVSGINNLDEIVGGSSGNDGFTHAFYWKDGAFTVLPCPPQTYCAAYAINDSGMIVGGDTSSTIAFASVWINDQIYDLNALIDPNDPLRTQVRLTSGSSINARGAILTYGVYTSGPNNGRLELFVLSPNNTVAQQ